MFEQKLLDSVVAEVRDTYSLIQPVWVKTEAGKIAKWGGRPPLACRGVRSRALMLRAPLFVFLNPF